MSWVPGWDSIASTGWWSNFYFWTGIVALLCLGVAEVVSHRYTERKDELVAEQQLRQKKAYDEAMAKLHLEAASAEERAGEANARAAEANERAKQAEVLLAVLRKQVGPRMIDHDVFIEVLKSHAPPKAVVIRYSEDAVDGSQLAFQLQSLLAEAKWNPQPSVRLSRDSPFLKPSVEAFSPMRSQIAIMGPWPSGMSPAAAADPAAPASVLRDAISSTLGSATVTLENTVPDGEVWLIILPKM